MRHVGVDPGWRTGAGVVLHEDGRVAYACAWSSKRGKAFRVEQVWMGVERDTIPAKSLHDIATQLSSMAGPGGHGLVVEGLFVGKNPRDSLRLAECAGELMGPLRDGCQGAVLRPRANSRDGKGWREVMLSRKSPGDAKAWGKLAIRLAQPAAKGGLAHLSLNEHVCEAFWMALYGMRLVAQRSMAGGSPSRRTIGGQHGE